ncbi:hypothetical protein CASFOL_004736 [Castilleja foliolosa]|uniref:Uncharacterized protein n=1 Tax=Castilleja foliolosa TaxID=1961234 RepID=A0ABD3EC10_9LAMI
MFKSFLESVLRLKEGRTLTIAERTNYLLFMINVFQMGLLEFNLRLSEVELGGSYWTVQTSETGCHFGTSFGSLHFSSLQLCSGEDAEDLTNYEPIKFIEKGLLIKLGR